MHVCSIASQQYASVPVGGGLPSHVGEPRNPRGTVDAIVGAVDGNERGAEVAQRGCSRGTHLSFGHHDAYWSAIQIDHFAVADLIVQLAEAVGSDVVLTDA